ncbi:MAG TPA: right-handed parallel beta-helix repeat-containing protein [Candidatus Aquabacterium excrementipullorum]|nr:right-handed parallel beta-helix repeat-containing protein [Candidatus Aquabacterium excrementipullorum]
MRTSRSILCKAFTVAGVLMGLQAPVGAAVVYIAPDGNDQRDGAAAATSSPGVGPMATLDGALRRLRALGGGGERRIVLLPGRYSLQATPKIDADDSGSPKQPLVIEAQKPGTVTLSGGHEIKGWQVSKDGKYWSVDTNTPRGFHMLWVQGDRAVRARSPKLGSYFVGGANVRPPEPEARPLQVTKPANIENTKRLILPDSARAELNKVASPTSAVLMAYHSWTATTQRIEAYDRATGAVTLNPQSHWPFFTFGPDQRFVLENLPEFLDEPGEWWLSPDGELRYVPRKGEAPATTVAVAPQLERLLDIEGSAQSPVHDVVLRGIRFSHSAAWSSPFIDGQAAINAPAAVVLTYARNVRFENCAFEHTGAHALWMRKGSVGNQVSRSVFRDLGAGGVRIGEATLPRAAADAVSGNLVEDSVITGGGKAFPGAVGIWIGQSGDNQILDNEIALMYYTGISVGWTWGFGESAAKRNTISGNYIHDVGQGVLSDLGGIYTLGLSEGTVLRDNRIEDVVAARKTGATGWGIYLDEGTSGVLVEGNSVLRTTGGGFHLHYGRHNVVRKNVFGFGEVAQAKKTVKEDSDLVFDANEIITGSGKKIYDGNWGDVKDTGTKVLKALPPKQKPLAAGVRRPSTVDAGASAASQ